MRWLVIALVACSHQASAPTTISSRHDAPVAIAPAAGLIDHAYVALVALPPLPEKRGLELSGDKACRAHLTQVRSYDHRTRADDLQRLIRVATLTGGDCRIDADEMLAADAPYRIGGCTGASLDEAILAWTRVAMVATTRARRSAALRNVASLAWDSATRGGVVAEWLVAGDAYVKASQSDRDTLELSTYAVDAYENALRMHPAAADVERIANKLDEIVDGTAGDRARAIRSRLRY
jgi:hypothetical protein